MTTADTNYPIHELMAAFQVDVVTHFGEATVLECTRCDARARDRVDQVVDPHAAPLRSFELRDDLGGEDSGASVPVVVAAHLRVTGPSACDCICARALRMHPEQDDAGTEKQPEHHQPRPFRCRG